ncbi:MAG: alpha/beta hydrolase [Gemmatimonadales bacterium]
MRENHLTVARTARYFTLGPEGRGVGEVWFLLHGYGQLAERFLPDFRPLDDGTRLLVAPEGLSRFYVDRASHQVGASWMTREDRLAEIADYVRYLDAVSDAVLRDAPRDRRVHVLGFSQGTATAARWMVQGALRAERLILWGGEVPPDLGLEREAVRDRLRALALTIVAGSRDEYITPKVLARDTARLDEAAIPYRVVPFDGGHAIDERVLRDLAATGGEPMTDG